MGHEAEGLPRVLIAAPHHPPETVAGAVRLASLARELARLGHEVTVVAPAPAEGPSQDALAREQQWPRLRVRRVAVAPRRKGLLGNAAHQLALRRALRAGLEAEMASSARPDVIIVSTPPPVAALAGRDVAARAGLPWVVDVRDLWPDVLIEAGAIGRQGLAARVLRHVERRLMRGAAAITTPTETKRARLAQRQPAPVTLVANGVDAAWCDEAAWAPTEEGPFEVLYAGNFGLAQDVPAFVEALVRLARAGRTRRPLRATLVGSGEDEARVRRAAEAAGGIVTLLAPEPRERVRARLLSCSCAFVGLRTSELVDAVPSKLLEAMGLGVPVIAAVAGEAAALVEAGGGGLVATPGDAGSLERALERMAAMPASERAAMGESGRRHVLAHHRREDAARVMSSVLVAACRGRSVREGRA